MLALIAIWALAEAIVFFIVADVPIMALGIKAGWRKALVGAIAASVVAAIGGLAMYCWAAHDAASARGVLEAIPGITGVLIDETVEQWRSDGLLAMVAGSFSGVPYKLYAFGVGATGGTAWLAFVSMSIAARLPRFVLVALAAGIIGPHLRNRFGPRKIWAAFGLAWVGFYAAYWSTMGI